MLPNIKKTPLLLGITGNAEVVQGLPKTIPQITSQKRYLTDEGEGSLKKQATANETNQDEEEEEMEIKEEIEDKEDDEEEGNVANTNAQLQNVRKNAENKEETIPCMAQLRRSSRTKQPSSKYGDSFVVNSKAKEAGINVKSSKRKISKTSDMDDEIEKKTKKVKGVKEKIKKKKDFEINWNDPQLRRSARVKSQLSNLFSGSKVLDGKSQQRNVGEEECADKQGKSVNLTEKQPKRLTEIKEAGAIEEIMTQEQNVGGNFGEGEATSSSENMQFGTTDKQYGLENVDENRITEKGSLESMDKGFEQHEEDNFGM